MEKLTVEGRNKYKAFNLNMKVQEEFAKLGGEIYDLISGKSKNPLGNRKVKSIISKINKLESRINKLESKEVKKPKKTAAKKTGSKSTKKTVGKATVKSRAKRKSSAAATEKNKKS